MASFGVIFAKEVKENLRDWRTIIPALFIGPVLTPVLLGTVFAFAIQQVSKGTDESLTLPVVGADHAPNLMAFLSEHRVDIRTNLDTPEAAVEAVTSRAEDVVLIVPDTFGEQLRNGEPASLELVFDQGRRNGLKPYRRTRALLEGYGARLGALRLLARGIDPRVVRPVAVDEIDVSTPSGRSILFLGMVTYVVLFSVLMGGLPVINDATAGERERKSLEPLLTTPIRRGHLVLEKIAAAAFFMLIALAVCLTTMTFALGYLPLEQLGMRSNFRAYEALQAFFILIPFVVFGAGCMSIVASFTKTYKEAQTYLGFVILVPTMPIIFAGLIDVKPSLSMMFVPSLSQHFLMLDLIGGNPINPVYLAASAATTLLLGLLAIAVTMRLYQREALLG